MSYKPFAAARALIQGAKPTRRELLQGAGEGLVALVTAATGVNAIALLTQTPANKQLDAFPESIPGAYDVKKHKIIDAQYCLVHVRQMHDAPDFAPELANDAQTREIQNDIYKILTYLVDKNVMHEIYVEGITSEREDDAHNVLTDRRLPPPEFAGAIGRIAQERNVRIRGADTAEALNRAGDAFRRYGAGEKLPESTLTAVGEQREDALLELIVQRSAPLAVTVFGGRHSWVNNVNKWNEKHPEKKYSLIVVTPEAFHKYVKN